MLRTPLARPHLRHFATTPLVRNVIPPPPAKDPQEGKDNGEAPTKPSESENIHNPVVPSPHAPTTSFTQSDGTKKPPIALATYDLNVIKQRMREWTDKTAITVRNRADVFTILTKDSFSQLGSHLNRATGYEEIEALKKGVVEQEAKITATRKAARQVKAAYEQAVIQRSNSQREVNDLLQRKSTWTDGDVGRFTTLVRQDHLYEQEEQRAKTAVDESEDAVEKEFSKLMRTILARYHEEQIWSDKIRSASTYGSLAALGLNLFVFIMAIVIVEPWKRRRLAQTFEKKIEELSKENAAQLDMSMQQIQEQLTGQEILLKQFVEDVLMKESALPQHSEELVHSKPHVHVQPVVPDVPEQVSRRHLELAVVGTGAFVVGVVGSLLLGR